MSDIYGHVISPVSHVMVCYKICVRKILIDTLLHEFLSVLCYIPITLGSILLFMRYSFQHALANALNAPMRQTHPLHTAHLAVVWLAMLTRTMDHVEVMII